jgi:catalase
MLWHFFLIHDEYGRRVGELLGLTAKDVMHLASLASQVLTEDEKKRLKNLGHNGDKLDPKPWGQWTSSVPNHQSSAEEVLMGKVGKAM